MNPDELMGSLAALDQYGQQPQWPLPALPPEQSPQELAARRVQHQYRNLPQPGTSNMEAVAEALIPQSPWEYGLAVAAPGAGLIGRGLAAVPRVVKMGSLAAGLGLTATEAEAGKAKIAAKIGEILKPGYLSPEDQKLFASRYPKAGDWEWKIDPKKPPGENRYQGKVRTDEEERLMAARTKVIEDMANEPWTPLFDPEKRFHVDLDAYVKQFGAPEDTRNLRMKDPKAAQRHLAISTGEEAQTKLAAALAEGEKIEKNAGRFYEVGQAEEPFLRHYNDPDTARAEFRKNIPQPMAATTGGSDPTSNLLQAGYVNWLREHGKKIPQESWDVPSPLGSSKFSVKKNVALADELLGPQGTGIGLENPKRYDFDWNFLGRRNAPVMDDQMIQIINPALKGSPPSGGYGLVAEAVHQMPVVTSGARDPQNVQELVWGGGKRLKEIEALMQPRKQFGREVPALSREEAEKRAFAGKPMMADINEAVERTSRLLQIPPAEAYHRMFIATGKNRIPVYGIGGAAVGLGSLADQSNYGR